MFLNLWMWDSSADLGHLQATDPGSDWTASMQPLNNWSRQSLQSLVGLLYSEHNQDFETEIFTFYWYHQLYQPVRLTLFMSVRQSEPFVFLWQLIYNFVLHKNISHSLTFDKHHPSVLSQMYLFTDCTAGETVAVECWLTVTHIFNPATALIITIFRAPEKTFSPWQLKYVAESCSWCCLIVVDQLQSVCWRKCQRRTTEKVDVLT